jgi:hypothetical protein
LGAHSKGALRLSKQDARLLASASSQFHEPPDAERHVRVVWEGGGGIPPPTQSFFSNCQSGFSQVPRSLLPRGSVPSKVR